MSAVRSLRAIRNIRSSLLFHLRPKLPVSNARDGDRHYASRTIVQHPDNQNSLRSNATVTRVREPEKEGKFYDFYLNWKVRDEKLTPSMWTHFLNDTGSNLPSTLQRAPLSVVNSGTEDVHLVRTCLEHFIATTRRDTVSKPEERDRYLQAMPGSRTLLWLLDGDHFHKIDIGLELDFVRAVVHCIAAERGEDALWMWLSIDEIPKFAKDWLPAEQIGWRGGVLRNLMESATFWADNVTQGLENSLELYEHAISLCRTREGQGPPHIPLYPAGVWLHKTLCSTSHGVSKTSPERFANSLALWSRDPDERRYNRTRLMRNHESHEALRFLQDCNASREPSLYVYDLLHPKDSKTAYSFFIYIIWVAQTLEKNGASSDARWVLDTGRTWMPYMFEYRRATNLKPLSEDLTTVRRRPTPHQITDGVPFGLDGVPILTTRRRQLNEVLVKRNAEERWQREILRSGVDKRQER